MKRSEIKRKTAIKRGDKPMKRGRVNPVNRKRKAKTFDRNYGDEADAIRAMPCAIAVALGHSDKCRGPIVSAHYKSRGAGGGRCDQYPCCQDHHDEQHSIGIKSFADRYGLDLRKLADDAAASHAPPLGIRGLAQRILAVGCGEHEEHRIGLGDDGTARAMFFGHVWGVGNRYFACSNAEPLDTYETDALLGWVRRECEREAERRRARRCEVLGLGPDLDAPVEYDSEREALAAHVAVALGLDAGLAEQLLDAAGVGHE